MAMKTVFLIESWESVLQTELACVTHGGAEYGEGLGLAGSGLLSLTGTDFQLVATLPFFIRDSDSHFTGSRYI